jgi:Flp pilus assembly protein TadD
LQPGISVALCLFFGDTQNMWLRRVCFATLTLLLTSVAAGANGDAALKARDDADVPALRRLISEAQADAKLKNTSAAYERVAQLAFWLCEAGHVNNDNKVVKQAAQDGIVAAEKAVSLEPNSSEAHRLNGELTGELIPTVFMGGMRHGKHAGDELDKAIQLDPKNAEAYAGRAIGYFFTPSTFGGSKEKAVEFLLKSIALDPSLGRAHILLAQFYAAQGKHEDAQHEINEALRIDPNRRFAKDIAAQIAEKK